MFNVILMAALSTGSSAPDFFFKKRAKSCNDGGSTVACAVEVKGGQAPGGKGAQAPDAGGKGAQAPAAGGKGAQAPAAPATKGAQGAQAPGGKGAQAPQVK